MTRGIPIVVLAATAVGSISFVPSNIDPVNKFGWGENVGWTNWLDANGTADGVFVDTINNFLSGFIWAENVGWINAGNGGGPYANTDGTNFGVNILGDDDLDGFAWGENIGWINFGWGAVADDANRARFDTAAGRFRGYAWGENVGWLNLDDATHFVAASVGCVDDAECNDGQLCTLNLCDAGACTLKDLVYADVNNDGFVNVTDVLCELDTFGGNPNSAACFEDGMGSPVSQEEKDIADCPTTGDPNNMGDGFINVSDVLAVLDTFAANPTAPTAACAAACTNPTP